MNGKLTQRLVDSAKPPGSGQTFIRDNVLAGLALRVTPTGAKSFIWEGRVRGRPRRITLGQYPAMSVLLARRKAVEMKAAVAQGRDPSLERHAQHEEPAFRDLAEVYIEQHARPRKKSWKEDARRLRTHLLPRFGTRRLTDIQTPDVQKAQEAIRRERGPYESNRTVVLLRTMFNLAPQWVMFTGPNPAAKVRLFHEVKRDRFLSPEELRRLNQALAGEPNQYWRAYFPLCLMLGSRKGELLAAQWTDIDVEQETWRLPMTKAGRPHLLPLPKPAVEILCSLPSRGVSQWVFPGGGSTGHLVEPKKAWTNIRKRAGVPMCEFMIFDAPLEAGLLLRATISH
jgi:integrase